MQPIIKQLLYDWAENLVCDWIVLIPVLHRKAAKSTVEIFVHSFIVWKDKTNSQAYSLIIYIQWTRQILLHFVCTDCNEKLRGMTQ